MSMSTPGPERVPSTVKVDKTSGQGKPPAAKATGAKTTGAKPGNRPGARQVGYPAAYDGVLAVAGVDRRGRHAAFSVTGVVLLSTTRKSNGCPLRTSEGMVTFSTATSASVPNRTGWTSIDTRWRSTAHPPPSRSRSSSC